MARKVIIGISLAVIVLLSVSLAYYFLIQNVAPPPLLLSKASRKELRVVISTNGIIEPINRTEVYSPIDAFVLSVHKMEGSEVIQGQPLMRLESQQIMAALSEARAALLQAKREARLVVAGPPSEEVAAMESAIAETVLQLSQQREDLRREEVLLHKEATTREAVENLRKQISLLELRVEGLKQKKAGLLRRYSDEEKLWEQNRVNELTQQVELLEHQVQQGTISVPSSGILYSLSVRSGSYASKGQLLAQLYQPGRVQLRANIDEPDLGRIGKGQRVLIEWDGLPDKQWTGVVDKLAHQVVALGNRSVGYVICAIDGETKELIPNLNVKVQVITASKAAALVIPRTAVFSYNGRPAVMLSPDGVHTTPKPVILGMVTPEEIEIVSGLDEGSTVVTNPGEAKIQ